MATRSPRSKTPAKSNVQVTPEEGKIENLTTKSESTEPANIETETPSDEPTPASEAITAERIQAEINEKLSNKSVEENIFVPSNPAIIEKAAKEISKEKGFELNRGTEVGARLMARARKRI